MTLLRRSSEPVHITRFSQTQSVKVFLRYFSQNIPFSLLHLEPSLIVSLDMSCQNHELEVLAVVSFAELAKSIVLCWPARYTVIVYIQEARRLFDDEAHHIDPALVLIQKFFLIQAYSCCRCSAQIDLAFISHKPQKGKGLRVVQSC